MELIKRRSLKNFKGIKTESNIDRGYVKPELLQVEVAVDSSVSVENIKQEMVEVDLDIGDNECAIKKNIKKEILGEIGIKKDVLTIEGEKEVVKKQLSQEVDVEDEDQKQELAHKNILSKEIKDAALTEEWILPDMGCFELNNGRKSDMNNHFQTHAGPKSFECKVCQKVFTDRSNLNRHLRGHAGEKPFACNICHRRFTVNSHLKAHLRIHTGDKPFECEECKLRFTSKSSLNRHLKIHAGEKPFECEVCQRKFTAKVTLNTHLITHTGEKPFECAICHRRFAEKGKMNAHFRIHTGETPYECEICHRRFTVNSSLTKHLRIHYRNKHLV